MAKSQPLKDPAAFLKDLVARKGDSGRFATMFRGANLHFDPHDHSHLDTHQDTIAFLQRVSERDGKYRKVISRLSHSDQVHETYRFKEYFGLNGVISYIRKDPEDGFSVTFTFPMVDVSRFHLDVEILSHMAILWAKIARVEIRDVRVFIDISFLRWEDMETENLLFLERESD